MAQSSETVTVANPAPLGLSGFALTLFVLSAVNAGLAPAAVTPVVIGLALFYGGFILILSGMWAFRAGNTFAATVFSSYGAFWVAFGFILLPGTGIAAALGAALPAALGIFLLGWTIFTVLMLIVSLKTNIAFILIFLLLLATLLLLTLANLLGVPALATAGGIIGILTALVAWYTALASFIGLPVGPRA